MRTPLAAALAIVLAFGCTDQPTTPTALNETAPAPSFNTSVDDYTCDELEALLAEKIIERDALTADMAKYKEKQRESLAKIDQQSVALKQELTELKESPLPDIAVEQRIAAIIKLIKDLQERRVDVLSHFAKKMSPIADELTAVSKEIVAIEKLIASQCGPGPK